MENDNNSRLPSPARRNGRLSVSLFIARRYLFSKKSTNVINLISAISVIGVTVATMAMVVVLSVFNGFRNCASKRTCSSWKFFVYFASDLSLH